MELELLRTYYPNGTNGVLCYDGTIICYTIELPWKNNRAFLSCIPEGRYGLEQRFSLKHLFHFYLPVVNGRKWILIHPANNAREELKGCIAPVTIITGQGKGAGSKQAMEQLKMSTQAAFAARQPVFLNIKKKNA